MSKIFDKDEAAPPRTGGVVLVRYLVRMKEMQYTAEAYNSLEDGLCTEEDFDNVILSGRLLKREKDELKQSVDGWKYTFRGRDLAGYQSYCCGKIIRTSSGKKFLVITAHESHVNYSSKRGSKKNV